MVSEVEGPGERRLMGHPSAVVLGGGLSGMAAAYALARAGLREIVIVERGSELGGLAGTFERDGHFYPLAYHHILHRDRTLLYVLHAIGALPSVRWRKIHMYFRVGGRLYDLADPADFMRFPMAFTDKLRFARLMLRSFGKSDWSDWNDHSARDLVDRWAGPGVRHALFEPLTRLKFQLPCDEVSGAWLGARLHFREGSAPLGYIPGANWTKVLCEGLARLLIEQGVQVRLRTPVRRLHGTGDTIDEVEVAEGERLRGDVVVSTMPSAIYRSMVPRESTPYLDTIRYTAMISVIGASRQRIEPDFYWMNLASLDRHACGIFLLNSLNPTIGAPGDSCVNFVTHLQSTDHPLFHLGDAELLAAYHEDFREIFGFEFQPFWTHITRLPMYSPIFTRSYRNPPVRSTTWHNVYFAGNYRTFPSVVSTGTAMGSGFEAAEAVLADLGRDPGLLAEAKRFRLKSKPRG
jgi:protoporphyrinogen oxidase